MKVEQSPKTWQDRFGEAKVFALASIGMASYAALNEAYKDEHTTTVGASAVAIGALAYCVKLVRDGRSQRAQEEWDNLSPSEQAQRTMVEMLGPAEVTPLLGDGAESEYEYVYPFSLYHGPVDPSMEMIREQQAKRLDDDFFSELEKNKKPEE